MAQPGITPDVLEPELLGMGQPAALRKLAQDLWRMQDAEEDWHSFQRWCRVAILHIRDAATRAERKQNAMEAARVAAESRIAEGLASIQMEGLGDGTAFNPHGFFVYCLWGKDPDRPLYVGLSTNILARLGAHLGNSLRRREIIAVTVTRFSTFARMAAAEDRLIRHYLPPWNTKGCEDRTAQGVG